MYKRQACGRPRTRCQAGGTSLILANGWQVEVLSGRGGKQPAAILIDTGTQRVLLDAGASLETAHDDGADAWLGRALAKGLDAVLITHDHVDHIGAAHRVPAAIPLYVTAEAAAGLPPGRPWQAMPLRGQWRLERPGARPVLVRTGASGHSLGGVWLHLSDPDDVDGGVFYSGDVSLESTWLAFDVPPRAELALLDASYGMDDTAQPLRQAALAARLDRPTLLPVPPSGRALEMALWLDALGRRDWSMDSACRDVLAQALAAPAHQFAPGVQARLAALQPRARQFDAQAPLLLAADADGQGGEAGRLLADPALRHQVIYTGYMPPALATAAAAGSCMLRWNVHPRLRDLGTLLEVTQASRWLPLFTAQPMPADPGVAPPRDPETRHAA